MATLYITEFSDITDTVRGAVQLVKVPAVAEQTVPIGALSVASENPFDPATRIVRIHTDKVCSIRFGTDPTAEPTDCRLAANQTEYFGVPTGGSYKVAVIANS